jgi:type IV pilus assembly protein PilM
MEVLIAASRKEKVEDRVAVAEAAGLKPLVMDVESYAAQAAFELVESQFPGGGKNQTIALVDIGANVMNVTILRNDQPVYAREQAFGGSQLTQDIMRQYGMSQEEAETAKRTATCPRTSNPTCCGRFLTTSRWKFRAPCSSSLPRPSTTRSTTSSWPAVVR